MGVSSLPTSRHLPGFISCAWDFPAAPLVTRKEEAGKTFPHPSSWPTRQRLPRADALPFPAGGPVSGRLGTLEEGQGVSAMGPLFPCPHGLRGQGISGPGRGLGHTCLGHLDTCALGPGACLTCWSPRARVCVCPLELVMQRPGLKPPTLPLPPGSWPFVMQPLLKESLPRANRLTPAVVHASPVFPGCSLKSFLGLHTLIFLLHSNADLGGKEIFVYFLCH